MRRTIYRVDRMDCPCEENLIRFKLQDLQNIKSLEFDLSQRTVTIFHSGDSDSIGNILQELDLGVRLIESITSDRDIQSQEDSKQRQTLWLVLAINFVFFLVEMSTGFFSHSMGLIADSLDMLADAFVYGLSLLAVGAVVSRKKRIAMICGYFQLFLACLGFAEVVRRFVAAETIPDFQVMIGVSFLALLANIVCLFLLQKTRSKDAHIQASIIFSSNDIIINTGVIIAGLLVWQFDTVLPDLILGTIVFLLVIRGALRILKLSK